MSAIAGICYWDGRPVPESQLAVLADYSRDDGPNSMGTLAPVPGLALQAHILGFDTLSAAEHQPHVFGQGSEQRSVLTFDGRLDNREDLLLTLHRDLDAGDVGDASIVGAAYARWGLDALPRLIGDWSLAIWDAPARRLVLACDYMGNRPLHYLEFSGGFAWATNLHALAACFGRDTEPDERYIAGRLTNGCPVGATPFKDVCALRGGRVLIAAESSGVTVRRYWKFEPSSIRHRNLDDYAHQMRELLTDAVRVRLRAHRTVWAHLSGGFDSSSIVCIANALIQHGRVSTPRLQPVSWVMSGSPESDESRFIEAVERWCGLTSVRREWERHRPSFSELLSKGSPEPYFPERALEAPVRAAGDHIVLAGDPGDLIMLQASVHSVSLIEPLHAGHPLRFMQGCLAYAKYRHRSLPSMLARLAWAAYAPSGMQRSLAQRQRRIRKAREGHRTTRDIAGAFGVTERLLALGRETESSYADILAAHPIVKRPFVSGLLDLGDSIHLWNPQLGRRSWMTYPYLHRPLVEFMLATPQAAFWEPRAPRAGMKRALKDVLPPELLARTSKGDPATASSRANVRWTTDLARDLVPGDPVREWLAVRMGYVPCETLSRSVEAVVAGAAPNSYVNDCLQLEAWLRSIEARRGERGVPQTASRSPAAEGRVSLHREHRFQLERP